LGGQKRGRATKRKALSENEKGKINSEKKRRQKVSQKAKGGQNLIRKEKMPKLS
jgi:hypothetical protein